MRISELIEQLLEVQRISGDLRVVTFQGPKFGTALKRLVIEASVHDIRALSGVLTSGVERVAAIEVE